MNRPHIIIINPDEMRYDAMGNAGNRAAYTPNLDALIKKDAVSFSRAYCQNPVCVPSRCSFFTGLYPHVNGHRTMYHLLHEGESSLFSELKSAGYYVWMNARNDLVAAQYPELIKKHASEIYYPNPKGGRPMEAKPPYSHYIGAVDSTTDTDADEVNAACKFIESYDKEEPMCLFLGLLNPHVPYAVEEKYRKLIKDEYIEKPVDFSNAKNKSLMLNKIRENANLEILSDDEWKEIKAVYLAQCAKVDDWFNMVCESLKKKGIYDDCAIFVLSDHGDFCGDYGLPEKAENSFEDCLVHVPFIIKPPKNFKVDCGTSDSLVELIDFYATVMDFAGVESDHTHFGKSLKPVLENRNEKIRDYVFFEGGRNKGEIQSDGWHAEGERGPSKTNDYWPKIEAQKDDLAHEKGTAIFDGRYKYVHRQSGLNEFYDLEKDPKELSNIYEEEKDSETVKSLRLKMLDWYQETCDAVPFEYDNRFTQEKVWSIVKGLCKPEYAEDVKQFIERNQPTLMQAIGYAFGKISDKEEE